MIPMRDGIKLFTVVLTPTQTSSPGPFLIQRTPYGSDFPLPENETIPNNRYGFIRADGQGRVYFCFSRICVGNLKVKEVLK